MLHNLLRLFQSLGLLELVQIAQATNDLWETMALGNVQKLEGLHFKSKRCIHHQKDQIRNPNVHKKAEPTSCMPQVLNFETFSSSMCHTLSLSSGVEHAGKNISAFSHLPFHSVCLCFGQGVEDFTEPRTLGSIQFGNNTEGATKRHYRP